MTVQEIKVTSCDEAFQIIDRVTFKEPKGYIFRGHKDSSWKLESTLRRHYEGKRGYMPLWGWDYEQMLAQFFTRLIHIGVERPFKDMHRRAQLEFGRHYGVPSPVIDFSYSPFVALFFAFNGVRPDKAGTEDYSVLNCINRTQLGLVFAREQSPKNGWRPNNIISRVYV